MSPRFVLGRENVPCIAEVVNRSLKADCTDFTRTAFHENWPQLSDDFIHSFKYFSENWIILIIYLLFKKFYQMLCY